MIREALLPLPEVGGAVEMEEVGEIGEEPAGIGEEPVEIEEGLLEAAEVSVEATGGSSEMMNIREEVLSRGKSPSLAHTLLLTHFHMAELLGTRSPLIGQ